MNVSTDFHLNFSYVPVLRKVVKPHAVNDHHGPETALLAVYV